MQKYRVIGTMSGTSVDGFDIAYCEFVGTDWKNLSFSLLETTTIPYPKELQKKLVNSISKSALDLITLDMSLGQWMGKALKDFIDRHRIETCPIASHGHTVFHQPENGLTLQIGNGYKIHTMTGFPVVFDFRTLDVCLGGQGAPLVPIGDQILFGGYTACLNIGGFANVSFEQDGKRLAFDICPTNIVLNELAESIGMSYDKGGEIARNHSIIPDLLVELNQIDFYARPHPKSLGKEWVEHRIKPHLRTYQSYSPEELIATYTQHMADQITRAIKLDIIPGNESVLVTGGGAKNHYLLELIRQSSNLEIVVPDDPLVEYKEALVFGLMGLLRIHDQNNCLSSVTGARMDASGGAIVGM